MTLDQIYARIPDLNCCTQCGQCCGPVIMTMEEECRIKAYLKIDSLPAFNLNDLACPMLDTFNKTCRIYDVRPFICRLYGTMEKLSCPHGCRPDRFITQAEDDQLYRQYVQSGGGLAGGFCGIDALDLMKALQQRQFF